jgi:uncharacterized protein YodC (DUF2158 family)
VGQKRDNSPERANAALAQMVERRTCNADAVGSTPARSTIKIYRGLTNPPTAEEPTMTTTHKPTASPDTYETLVEGSIVRLVSGGPNLTVISVCDDCQEAEIAWFNGASLEINVLPIAALVQSGAVHLSTVTT